MREFEIRAAFPTGSILIGGHSALPVGASSAHARDHRDQPVIPATALRGALRETLEALLRGVGRGACDSGTGVDPGQAPTTTADQPTTACVLEHGERCVACRLFGTRAAGLAPGARVFSSLILGDAQLEGDAPVTWGDRQHVSVSRAQRSAEDKRLFLRRTPHLHDRQFVARGYTIEPEFDEYLEAAVRATKHIGSGRSVGLARVNFELIWGHEISPVKSSIQGATLERDVRIRVTLLSPTLLGGAQVGNNYRPTRAEITGSVLRGAIGFAMARTLENPDANPGFQELMDEKLGAHFGFLYPVGPASRADNGLLPGPWPLTARACKSHPHTHGVVDTLFDRIATASLTHVGQVESSRGVALSKCSVAPCPAALRGVPGTRGCTRAPNKRVVTRVSIERRSTSARDGALFSYELLEPGTVFEGTIRNVPNAARPVLNGALELPIHVGRGASAGWGKVSVEVLPGSGDASIEDRGSAFTEALRKHFEAAGLPTDAVARFVPISLLSPLLPDRPDGDGCEALGRALEGVQEWVVVARRFIRDGGWDQRTGRPFAELAVAGGAVYVARLAKDWMVPDMLEKLRSLEREGVGRRRHQGYGHALLFDPFILNRSQAPVSHVETHQQVRSLRRELVIAAERVIRDAFAGGDATQPPSKTQFSRLVGICGEATCAEEIENYLRYQAGREVKRSGVNKGVDVWRIDFVKAVIGGLAKVLHSDASDSGKFEEARDRYRVEAWRLYATYMTRAYTYEHAVRPDARGRTGGRHG